MMKSPWEICYGRSPKVSFKDDLERLICKSNDDFSEDIDYASYVSDVKNNLDDLYRSISNQKDLRDSKKKTSLQSHQKPSRWFYRSLEVKRHDRTLILKLILTLFLI